LRSAREGDMFFSKGGKEIIGLQEKKGGGNRRRATFEGKRKVFYNLQGRLGR